MAKKRRKSEFAKGKKECKSSKKTESLIDSKRFFPFLRKKEKRSLFYSTILLLFFKMERQREWEMEKSREKTHRMLFLNFFIKSVEYWSMYCFLFIHSFIHFIHVVLFLPIQVIVWHCLLLFFVHASCLMCSFIFIGL